MITLFVDTAGWPTPLDSEFVGALIGGRIGTEVQLHRLDEDADPGAGAFLLLTRPLVPAIRDRVTAKGYVLYTDSADSADVRALPVLVPPYRIAQTDNAGLEFAAEWIKAQIAPTDRHPEPPPIKFGRTRWRNLASNKQDPHYQPEEFAASLDGAAGYRIAAASRRGKTHAHAGTFRDDAVAIAATGHWNIVAVSDGAGTAPLSRVGSNLAVTEAVAAMKGAMPDPPATEDLGRAIWAGLRAAYQALKSFSTDQKIPVSDLSCTLQLLIHWPQAKGCLLGVAHVGDGIITAETADGQYYLLTEPDTDPEDSSRTLFLTSGPLRGWMERTKVYQFDDPLDIVAMMTDGLSGDLEPYVELLHNNLFEVLRHRVICYPLPQRELALLAMISYDRRGSFDDRTLAVLSRG
ncbi:MAG TPA: PP2C family serine/threonine-protein phosphatase [Aggregatilineales bacterium]|nr:PP2C family serine/threonine-protein phosphatase [Aggregatilineales bacterium]